MATYAHSPTLQNINTTIIYWSWSIPVADLRFCRRFGSAKCERRPDTHILRGLFVLNIHLYHLVANTTILSMAIGGSVALLQLLFAASVQLQRESAK